MPTGGRDLYDVLGVTPTAAEQDLKRAWRQALLRVHPDVGGSVAETLEVQAAYEVLSDPQQRTAYDQQRQTGPPSGSAASGIDDLADRFADAFVSAFEEAMEDIAETLADAFRAYAKSQRGAQQQHPRDDLREWTSQLRDHAPLPRCVAFTRAGHRCLNRPSDGSEFCRVHGSSGHGSGGACATCGVATRLRGSAHCSIHSTAAEVSASRRTTPAGQCRATTKRGNPCGGSPVSDGLCYQHGVIMENVARRMNPSASRPPPTTAERTSASTFHRASTGSDPAARSAAGERTVPTSADREVATKTANQVFGQWLGCAGWIGLLALGIVWFFYKRSDPEMLEYSRETIQTIVFTSVCLVVAGAIIKRAGRNR